jgi:hypothetical protein
MKKTKNAPTADPNGVITPAEGAPKAPTMTVAERKKAFALYDVSEEKVEKARQALEDALNERSDIVERIHAGAGKGPFSYKGTILTPICRTAKSTGNKRWFFKGPGTKDLIEV